MTHATVVVDNNVMLDTDLAQWEQKPPDLLLEFINRKGKPDPNKPWLNPVAGAVIEAMLKGNPVSVRVETYPASGGWRMDVGYIHAQLEHA